MTTLQVGATRIQARAARLDPVKLLVALVSVVPWLVCFTARVVWLVLSLLVAAGLEGWDAAGQRIAARQQRAAGSAGVDPRGG